MKKKLFYWSILLSSSFIIPVSTLTLTSCTSKNNNEQMPIITIDATTNNFLFEKSANDWIRIINSNNNDSFLLLQHLIEIYNTNNENNKIILNNDARFVDSKILFNNNDSKTTTTCLIQTIFENNQKKYEIDLKNIFYFANNIFTPPTIYTYTFNQVDLSNISDRSYNSINNAEWTNAFNSYTNSKIGKLIIPQFAYKITSKILDSNNPLLYTITYSVDPLYSYQISLLPNAVNFKDITIIVNLSPYINKKLQTEFSLNQADIDLAFGTNTTIDSINKLSPLQIYQKLSEYVKINLPDIQPIRDCLENSVPLGFQKIQNITNSKQLEIQFESNNSSIIKYKYIFNLTFN